MSALWPATLHHLSRSSPEPERLARFYGELLGDRVDSLPGGAWLVAGPGRRLVVERGDKGSVPYFGMQMKDGTHLSSYRKTLERGGLACEPFASHLFGGDAFSVTDPDSRRIVFGLPVPDSASSTGTPGQIGRASCRERV